MTPCPEAYQVRDNDSAHWAFGGGQIATLPIRFSLGLVDSVDHAVVSARVGFRRWRYSLNARRSHPEAGTGGASGSNEPARLDPGQSASREHFVRLFRMKSLMIS